MAKPDPNIAAHLEWIGFVRPTGLVVSAPALDRAGAILDRRDVEGQRLLRECAEERRFASREEPQSWLPDFRAFASSVLGWSFSPICYAGTDEAPIPAELEAVLSDSGGSLRPDFAVRTEPLRSPSDAPSWQLLVQVCEPGEDFDHRVARGRDGLEASPHGRMERLLRRTAVPAGLLFNGLALRLISAPRGESSGWLDFRVADMVQTAGRPISTAMRLLLHERRLLTLPRQERLAALLEDSRKCQNEVSERLAQQVLHVQFPLALARKEYFRDDGSFPVEPATRRPQAKTEIFLYLSLGVVLEQVPARRAVRLFGEHDFVPCLCPHICFHTLARCSMYAFMPFSPILSQKAPGGRLMATHCLPPRVLIPWLLPSLVSTIGGLTKIQCGGTSGYPTASHCVEIPTI